MSRIDYAAIAAAGGIGKGVPIKEQRRLNRAEAVALLKDAYKDVDDRDKLRSWVSGKTLVRGVANDKARLEHHHLAKRSLDKSRIDDPTNVISVSAFEAEYLDNHYLIPVNADGEECHNTKLITGFNWNPRVVDVKHPPFQVRVHIPAGR